MTVAELIKQLEALVPRCNVVDKDNPHKTVTKVQYNWASDAVYLTFESTNSRKWSDYVNDVLSGDGGQQPLRIICVSCQEEFIMTEGEQKFFKDHGLVLPKRCPECRQKRKRDKWIKEHSV